MTVQMFYHVSPSVNRVNIENIGVEPIFSRGKAQVSWFVTKEKLAWAILHTARRHKCAPADISVFAALTLKKGKNTRYKGIFYSACNHRVSFVGTALELLDRIGEDRL